MFQMETHLPFGEWEVLASELGSPLEWPLIGAEHQTSSWQIFDQWNRNSYPFIRPLIKERLKRLVFLPHRFWWTELPSKKNNVVNVVLTVHHQLLGAQNPAVSVVMGSFAKKASILDYGIGFAWTWDVMCWQFMYRDVMCWQFTN